MNYKMCYRNHICSSTTCKDYNKCDGDISKYKNRKVEYKGLKFDSKKEYLRYLVLEDMQKKKEITELRVQVPFELIPPYELNGKKYKGMKYIADFTYMKDGELVVEDVKPSSVYQTDVYKIKRKLMAYVHKVQIKEVY